VRRVTTVRARHGERARRHTCNGSRATPTRQRATGIHSTYSNVGPTLPEGVFAGFVVSDTVTVQEPVRPAVTEAEHDTVVVVSSFGGGVKVTATLVGVVVAPSGEPVTISVNGPVGVDAEVEIVKTLEPVGVTGLLLVAKLQPTPVGRGVTHDRVTGTAVPAVKVAVTVTVPELPWTILTGPLFDSE